MTYDEKLALTLDAINEARQFTRKGHHTKLHIGTGNGLSQIPLVQLHDILLQLQDDEKIIEVKDIPTKLKSAIQAMDDVAKGEKYYFLIDIFDVFNDWLEKYKLKQKGKIENLSEVNFSNVYHVLSTIENHLQLSQSSKVNISFVNSFHEIEGYESEDIDALIDGNLQVLEYLKKIGVVETYSHGAMSLDAEIDLHIDKYIEAFEIAEKIRQIRSKSDSTNKLSVEEKVKVTYDPQKGLLHIGDKKVKLNKDSFRAKLLEILLKDEKSRKKEWSWDEIIEEIEDTKDILIDKKYKNKFYTACDGLSKQVASKTGINDLLNYTKSTVQLNSNYL